MKKNIVNNASVSVNNASVEKKEDKDMMNLTVKDLRGMAKAAGIVGYSNMKKAELIVAIEERKTSEVEAPVVEEKPVVKEVGTPSEYRKGEANSIANPKWEEFKVAFAKEVMEQTVNKKDALFFVPTKAKVATKYFVVASRIWGVTAKLINEKFGKEADRKKDTDRINRCLAKLVADSVITATPTQRSYIDLVIDDMTKEEKDALNKLYVSKDVTVVKNNNTKARVTAVTDNGKEALNKLYPNFVYGATSDQMNAMWTIWKAFKASK